MTIHNWKYSIVNWICVAFACCLSMSIYNLFYVAPHNLTAIMLVGMVGDFILNWECRSAFCNYDFALMVILAPDPDARFCTVVNWKFSVRKFEPTNVHLSWKVAWRDKIRNHTQTVSLTTCLLHTLSPGNFWSLRKTIVRSHWNSNNTGTENPFFTNIHVSSLQSTYCKSWAGEREIFNWINSI